MTEETAFPVKQGCLPKVTNTWRSVFETLSATNRVYPSDPVPPKNSEFIIIEPKIKIRVVHLTPEKVRESLIIDKDNLSKRSSLAEEYWFMKNKPLRNTQCNCSFRRSFRNSNGAVIQKDIPKDQLELAATYSTNNKINHINGFAEGLLQDTLSEAFNECLKNGVDNLAYETSHNDTIDIKQKNMNREINGKPSEKNDELFAKHCSEVAKKCVHNKIEVKPLIMLIHGLGCTADIWDILMHNLTFSGFEVVAPDVLGHGYSSAPNRASLYHFKSLLTQIMQVFDNFMKEEDERKCILIGHSYGCSLITALYPHRATKIAQLVLISGGGPTPLAPPADMNDISPYGWAHNLCYPFMFCGLKRSFFYSSRGKNFKFCEEENSVPPHIRDYLIEGQYWPEGDASFHRRILVPTLLVHGLQDRNITLVQECEMERTIPRAFLELLPDAGHMSMLEVPEHLTHMISCFLEMWT